MGGCGGKIQYKDQLIPAEAKVEAEIGKSISLWLCPPPPKIKKKEFYLKYFGRAIIYQTWVYILCTFYQPVILRTISNFFLFCLQYWWHIMTFLYLKRCHKCQPTFLTIKHWFFAFMKFMTTLNDISKTFFCKIITILAYAKIFKAQLYHL